MTVRLRWTGPLPRTFMTHGVGEVQPGRSFPVPDDAAASFLAHDHVELADPPAAEPQDDDRESDPQESQEPAEQPAPAKARRGKNAPAQPDAEPAEPQQDTAA